MGLTRLIEAIQEFIDACIERVVALFRRGASYRLRWTYVTRDKDWGSLLGDHPELHELADPGVIDLALNPNGDHVFIPTPNGGVTAVIVMTQDQAESIVEAWHSYQDSDEDDDDYDEDNDATCGDLLDEWTGTVVEHIESALDEGRDLWETEE